LLSLLAHTVRDESSARWCTCLKLFGKLTKVPAGSLGAAKLESKGTKVEA
jgi:hypothetical protein